MYPTYIFVDTQMYPHIYLWIHRIYLWIHRIYLWIHIYCYIYGKSRVTHKFIMSRVTHKFVMSLYIECDTYIRHVTFVDTRTLLYI